MATKIIDINELKKRKSIRQKMQANQDPTMDSWLKGILVGYQLEGDAEKKEYFLRGLALGFEASEQDKIIN